MLMFHHLLFYFFFFFPLGEKVTKSMTQRQTCAREVLRIGCQTLPGPKALTSHLWVCPGVQHLGAAELQLAARKAHFTDLWVVRWWCETTMAPLCPLGAASKYTRTQRDKESNSTLLCWESLGKVLELVSWLWRLCALQKCTRSCSPKVLGSIVPAEQRSILALRALCSGVWLFSEILINTGALLCLEELGISGKWESHFVVNRFSNLCDSLKMFDLSSCTLNWPKWKD